MAKKHTSHKSNGVHQELHPMLLKGIVLGLLLGLGWMVYVNMLRNKYDTITDGGQMNQPVVNQAPKATDSKMMKETPAKEMKKTAY